MHVFTGGFADVDGGCAVVTYVCVIVVIVDYHSFAVGTQCFNSMHFLFN